ncbi:cell envelope integrity EipB family protein [Microvirga pudoricolor]|uniref:cell envelope integrity EipB family protein n=1 Tax=Microvirga pudoricolor TaxID=2778729 RepID=UPI001950A10E|nr:cell envelope integrity EipB family protein [Microvirga pudoricolor]MBM6594200.1 cell envelope integrity EipB family protein [Microvirga pudoricolor]
MRSLILLSSLLLSSVSAASAQTQPSTPVQLVPHRAVYDLSLVRSTGSRGVESATGRIAMDFGGDACDGYTLKYRQVTILNGSETGSRTLDVRTATFESGDGNSMRFKTESASEGTPTDNVDGEAKVRPDGNLSVSLKGGKEKGFSAGGHPVFPTEHMKRLIEAARAGQNTVSVKIYDGSDGGTKVYDTLALIGRKIEGGAGANLEEAVRKDALAGVARWPVTISYFNVANGDQTPAYTISFDLYENGISRALKLDYGDFALKGDLKSLDLSSASACQR